MDKQTAIDLLDNLLGMVEDNHESDYDAALHMGIDALKSNAPNALSALDCVDRQAAIDLIAYSSDDLNDNEQNWDMQEEFRKLPSVQPDIIQCKDCENWQTDWTPNADPGSHFCDMVDGFPEGDWYCADAKRRSE